MIHLNASLHTFDGRKLERQICCCCSICGVFGSGGIKAALPAHGAGQFDEKDPKEVRQMSSYFNWFLLATSLGAIVSLTFIVWVQDNKGFDAGFRLSAMFLGLIVFVSGLPRYRIQVIKGTNALTEIFQFLNLGSLDKHGFARNMFWSIDADPTPFSTTSSNKTFVNLILKPSEEHMKSWPCSA